jgi:hypothetical protein
MYMEKQKRIFCGSGKKANNYDIVNISVCLSDLPKEFITEAKNKYGVVKKYIKLKVVAKREPEEYGKTHSVEVDTWKFEEKKDDKVPF